MNESRQTIAKLLVAFADAMNSMDDREFDLLIQGKAKFRLVEEKPKQEKKHESDACLDRAVAELAKKLNDAESRESAESLLASINYPRRRKFLLLLARSCGVTVGSKDRMARIEQKLVEDVVGSKLRSQAIKKVAF